MAEITLESLTKVYPDGTKAVSELSLDVASGELKFTAQSEGPQTRAATGGP